MTDRALWVAAQEDYTNALKIAEKVWRDSEETATPEALQAAAATILIHITKLRSEERIHIKIPQSAAPQPAEAKTAAQSGAVPPCPQCGGAMWDNRLDKKNPRAPDFKCKDKACKDAKGMVTGIWEKDLAKKGGANRQPVPAGSYDEIPPSLQDDSDSLPF